jgi:TolB-like protein
VRHLVPISLVAVLGAVVAAGAAAADPVRVALLPVTVHSSEAGSDYLSAGLASMLASRLEQFDDVALIRLDDAKDAAQGRDAAVAAAQQAGAEYVVFGSFTQFGQGASLDLQCANAADASGDGRRIFVQSGTLGEIIPKLDELAAKIHLHVSGGKRAGDAAAPAPGGSNLANLESRVEALERTVFRSGPEQGPTAPPAPKAASGGATGPR